MCRWQAQATMIQKYSRFQSFRYQFQEQEENHYYYLIAILSSLSFQLYSIRKNSALLHKLDISYKILTTELNIFGHSRLKIFHISKCIYLVEISYQLYLLIYYSLLQNSLLFSLYLQTIPIGHNRQYKCFDDKIRFKLFKQFATSTYITMDPNSNRNSMGSRAGTSVKPKFGAGNGPAPSRQGTAGRNLNPLSGVGSTVQVKQRPLTTGGGINGPQGGASQRKVYDRNFYVMKTKEKMMTVQEETTKLKAKSQQIGKQQQLYNKLQSRLEELNNQVRNLEGQLADYNLALDKLRANTRPQDVKNTYQHVKNNNDKLKQELDEIFLERKKIQEQNQYMQNQLQNIHKQMELRLNQLDPYQRSQYQKLIGENTDLINEYNSKQIAMEELLNKLANSQNKLRMDSQKLKGQLLKEQIGQLQARKSDYQIQLNEAGLSVPQARDLILARMKEDNTSISNMEKRVKEVKKNIDIYEKKLRDLEAALEDKKTEEEDKKKYQILYQKDRQMDQFLNSFDKVRSNQIHQLEKLEVGITQHLEQVSKVLQISNQLPTGPSFAANRGDKSQNTLAQAKAQYEIRLNNLRALQNTQKRTLDQTQNLKGSIQKMKDQISDKFDKVEDIKLKLNSKKQKLIEDEKTLQQIKDKISPTINNSDYQVNIAQKKYQMHDQFSVYNANQRKLSQLQGKRYYLKQYINTKSKDINYEDIKNQCMSFSEELNKKLVK